MNFSFSFFKIRQRLEEEGVDPNDFSIVDQSKCIEDSNLNVRIDDKTFSAGNVADVVKKVESSSNFERNL